jgi:hypothetical protein
VDPGDVPAEKAARRLHLTPSQFEVVKDRLFARGFPRADPDTGMYDLAEIDRWRTARHSGDALTESDFASDRHPEAKLGEKFRAAKERQRHG